MSSMHLALFSSILGTSYAGWRHPETLATSDYDWKWHKELAQRAEQAKFDLIFIADKLMIEDTLENTFNSNTTSRVTGWPDAITLMSSLAAVTEKIGVAGTFSSTFLQPYVVARMLATLDNLSGGRVGWNIVTSSNDREAQNFDSKATLLHHDKRYEKAGEFIEAIKALWDTWEDDAILIDKAAGSFADKSKIHYANFEGEFFNIKGPLNVPRPVQGHPVTIQAGGSGNFVNLAARTADAVFTTERSSLEAGKEYYAQFKSKVISNGRHPDELKILQGLTPIIGRTEKEAKEKFETLLELQTPQMTFSHLSSTMNYDWSQHDLDDLVPNILDQIERRERFTPMIQHAVDEKLTLRQFARWFTSSGLKLVGTPSYVADHMAKVYKEKVADGFIIGAAYSPGGAYDIFDSLVPELQARGVFRTEYDGTTLRDHFGLKRPANAAHKVLT